MSDTPIPDAPSDELGEKLIACGFVSGGYMLDLNRTLSTPPDMVLAAPWNLPSRLFRFPSEFGDLLPDGSRAIGLMHPLLSDHPFVAHVETCLGTTLDPGGAPNRCGYSNCGTALWWHAVDLVSSGNWRALLETRQFTTQDDIVRAVAFGCRYSTEGRNKTPLLSTADARAILRTMDCEEPRHRAANLRRFDAPAPCAPDGGSPHWPINALQMAGEDIAWGMIHGIEDGWLNYRSGHLEWSPLGRERHGADMPETTPNQSRQQSFDF